MEKKRLELPIQDIVAFCRRYPVRELLLFGSALGPEFGPDSDLDFLVEFEPEAQVGFLMLSRMQRELAAIVQRQVDLVPKSGLKPRIRQAVLANARPIYAS